MSTEMKTGLVLSGGGAVGAYQAGVVKALAECGAQISMVSGASIGALNGAIIAASPDLSEAAARLEALWKHLGENQVLSVNRSVYFSLLKKLLPAMNLCQVPGRAGALLTTLPGILIISQLLKHGGCGAKRRYRSLKSLDTVDCIHQFYGSIIFFLFRRGTCLKNVLFTKCHIFLHSFRYFQNGSLQSWLLFKATRTSLLYNTLRIFTPFF